MMRTSLFRLTKSDAMIVWTTETALVVVPPGITESVLDSRDTSTSFTAPQRPITRALESVSWVSPSPMSPRPHESLSFVEHAMSHRPGAFFNQVLFVWDASLQDDACDGGTRSDILSRVPLREKHLLNSKLYDPCFDVVRERGLWWSETHNANDTGSQQSSGTPHATSRNSSAATAGADAVTCVLPQRQVMPCFPTLLREPGGLFYVYSLVHFAAELGSMSLLEFALSRLPNGVPFVHRQESPLLLPGTPLLPRCANGQTAHPSVDWIVCRGADFTGAYPMHLAASNGAVEMLEWAANRYGVDFTLQHQHMRTSLRGGDMTAATGGCREGLTVVGSALAAGQLVALEWLLARHPGVLEVETAPERVAAALTAGAVRQGNGCARTLTFLHDHNLLHAASTTAASVSSPAQLSVALHTMGLRPLLFASAEAGNAGVLQWLLHHFGEQVLLVTDRVGATIVHHCARGGHTDLLRALLGPTGGTTSCKHRTTGDDDSHETCPTAEMSLDADLVEELSGSISAAERWSLVDQPDHFGRTPAVWCTLGSSRPARKVDTLSTLLALGSSWPAYKGESGETLLSYAQSKHSTFSLLCRYIKQRCQ